MSPGDKVNILLVDDQPAKLMSYEVVLSELGENLIKANSANEALQHLLRHEVAVVLIDVVMPDLEWLRTGGNDPRTSTLPAHGHHLRLGHPDE